MSIDDSSLFHAGAYDPVKAREYYLRTRKLKGRQKKGTEEPSSTRPGAKTANPAASRSKSNRSKSESRRAELLAQQKALRKRLDRLRQVLKKLVEEAKKDAQKNASPVPKKNEEKTKTTSSSGSSKGGGKDSKDRKPLTAKQKSDRAKKAKEEYEKEHPNSLSNDVAILKEQVKDIQGKIKKALDAAEDRRKKAGKKTQTSGAKHVPSSGPRGR